MEVGLAFIDQLLQPVSFAIERSHGARVKGRSLGHAAHQFPEGLGHPMLPFADGAFRGEFGNLRVSQTICPLRLRAQIIRQAARVVSVSDGWSVTWSIDWCIALGGP